MICRKSSRSISIDNHFCNRFINLGRPIFSLNHSGASAATVFTIPDNIRDRACAVSHSRWAGHPICGPSWIIAIWFSYCSVNPLRPQNCICLQSDLSCLLKLNCNLFNHHERLDFFFSASARISNPPLRLLVGCDSNGRQRRLSEPALWLRNDLSIPRAPENMSHKIS